MNVIDRSLKSRLDEYMGFFPVTAIVGPRQCGKTTLAKVFMEGVRSALYLDLERPSDLARLAEPETYLGAQRGRVVCLDEIQRAPDLFQVLRTLVDETGAPGQFLVLGSASPELLRQSSETLAGRIGYLELTPFSEKEVGAEHQSELWIRGGFPRSFFAPSDHLSRAWRDNFIQTYLERDLPQLGVHIPAPTLRHFWEMCAHLQGELWNHAKVASALGVTGKTAAHYLTVLEQSYMLRRLPPTATNGKKRLVKSPRVYLRDSGLLHRILRIDTMDALCGHPVRGASWEGYVIEQIAAAVPDADLSFYRTSGGAEIDLLVRHANRLTAIEIKASSAPHVERGFWSALEDLQPDDAWIAAQIVEPFPLRQNVTVASVEAICQSLATSSDGFRKHSMSDA